MDRKGRDVGTIFLIRVVISKENTPKNWGAEPGRYVDF